MNSLESLAARLKSLQAPLRLVLKSRQTDSNALGATQELLDALLADIPTIHTVWEQADTELVVEIHSQDGQSPISFWGTPSGFELEGLVLAMEAVGVSPPDTPELSDALQQTLQGIGRPVLSDLFVTPT